jgi:hypothetical protein
MDDDPDPVPRVSGRRSHHRLAVAAEAILRREGGNNYRVRVFDISETGCKVEIVERPSVAEGVWVKFEGLENIHATVSWIAHPVAGLKFDRPIHRAVFEMLMARLSDGGPTR